MFTSVVLPGPVIANRMPAGTSVPAKDFLGAREDFLQIS
jgi:hypothetical protein